jgi:hypothetical protein
MNNGLPEGPAHRRLTNPGNTAFVHLPFRHTWRDAAVMPDRSFPVVDALIRHVQRVAANRPDPMHILAQTISLTGEIGADPYAVLGVLVEGAVLTVARHIPAEQQTDMASMLVQLLEERLKAHGIPRNNP